jgi:chemotaxis protein CheX
MGSKGLDTKFINLFLNSIETTFIKVFQCDLTLSQIYFMKDQLSEDNVAVMTGVIGNNYTGMVVYRMHNETAQRMIDFLNPDEIDSSNRIMTYESLGEIINIISGNTMTRFSENNLSLNITTPSIIAGDTFELFTLNQITLSADMLSPFGTVEIDLAIKHF